MDWWELWLRVLGLVVVIHLTIALFDCLQNRRLVKHHLPAVGPKQEQLGPAPLASMEDLGPASLDTNAGW